MKYNDTSVVSKWSVSKLFNLQTFYKMESNIQESALIFVGFANVDAHIFDLFRLFVTISMNSVACKDVLFFMVEIITNLLLKEGQSG